MVSEGSEDEINENKGSKKSNKIEAEGDQRKTKKLLWCRNIKAEVITKVIPGLIPTTYIITCT